MPTRPPRYCRTPGCSAHATPGRTYCAHHDPGDFANTTPMTADYRRNRALALNRDHHQCVLCGHGANQVDHIKPRHLGGTDELDNLRSLCRRCHAPISGRQGGNASAHARSTKDQP